MGIRLPRKDWRTLWRDRSGATALITGLAFLLIACAAMTIYDLSNTNSQKAKLQDIIDAATLAAAKVGGDDEAAIQKAGHDYLKAHLPEGVYKNLEVEFIPTDKTVRATATAGVDPYFLNVFMNGPVDIALDSEVVRQVDGSLEVALVLDTTKSMEPDNKIQDLRAAAEALVDKVTAVEDADVKIAVVPFANYVNVGVHRRNERWVDIGADYDIPPADPTCYDQPQYKQECESYGSKPCEKKVDGVKVQTTCPDNKNCRNVPNGTKRICPGPTKMRFRGCVGSPAYPKSVTDDATSRYPGIWNATCAAELTPLTDRAKDVKKAIDKLTPDQSTYLPSGLIWGFNVLSPTAPFTEARPYDDANRKPRKALVLMSDGANTMRVKTDGTGYHEGKEPSPQANQYTEELCANIKAKKIEIYTVAFKIDDASAHGLLARCASSSGNYYKADSAAELLKAFEAIGASLENLRIAH